MNVLLVCRGVSGSGKSTFANFLKEIYPQATICCADDYFMKDGNYTFDASKIGKAHGYSFYTFAQAVERRDKLIIIANTNTCKDEFKKYEEYVKDKDYKIIYTVIENRHGNKDVHSVPPETIKKQRERLKNSIQL